MINRALLWFGVLWAAFVTVLTMIDLWHELSTASSIWEGWNRFADFGGPFNLKYYATRIVLLSPAIAALAWRQVRQERNQPE